jgi:hypothetical protein
MNIYGANWIRFIAVVGGTAFFAYLYGSIMADTWPATQTPKVNADDIKIATALAGALGGLFAVALGVERQEGKQRAITAQRNPPSAFQATFTVGRTLTAWDGSGLKVLVATIAVWVYFLTGLAAAATWYWNRAVTPDILKTLAEIIGGYIIALIAALAASN